MQIKYIELDFNVVLQLMWKFFHVGMKIESITLDFSTQKIESVTLDFGTQQ